MRKVEERILETLKIPNAKDLLNPPVEPTEQNAVNENVAASLGRPVTAFPEQDHLAHLQTHISYLMSPTFGSNPIFAPVYIPNILNHIKEHVALWYASTVFDVSTEAMGGKDLGDAMREMDKKDVQGRKALDRMLSEASTAALTEGSQLFQQVPQIIQQAQQIMQQFQQQPMQDPRMALETQKLQLEGQKAQQAAQKAQMDAQVDAQKMQMDAQKMQQDAQMDAAELQAKVAIEQQRQQSEDARTAAELQARMSMNSQDNQTAMALAQAEIVSGERIAVSTGTGINPNP
jgi:hypothetical protein